MNSENKKHHHARSLFGGTLKGSLALVGSVEQAGIALRILKGSGIFRGALSRSKMTSQPVTIWPICERITKYHRFRAVAGTSVVVTNVEDQQKLAGLQLSWTWHKDDEAIRIIQGHQFEYGPAPAEGREVRAAPVAERFHDAEELDHMDERLRTLTRENERLRERIARMEREHNRRFAHLHQLVQE